VIDSEGVNRGIMPTAAALQIAIDAGMDLVEINATAIPPIVKIMDYGRFKYDQQKKAAEARKTQKKNELREVWLRPFIEENDLNTKMKKILEWLADGEKVKISIMIKGRKIALARSREAVAPFFDRLLQLLEGKGVLEAKSKPDERTKSIIVAPVK
jgi:translation initiation factor IF-3